MTKRQPNYAAIATVADLRKRLRNESEARKLFEWMRWPEGRHCPECGVLDPYEITSRRPGLYQCRDSDCGIQFSATSGTPLHATKLPIATWLEAMFLIVSSSKGVSSVVLAKQIGVSQPTAWKMGHAIRLMMRPAEDEPLLSGVVEVDDRTDGGDPARANRARYGAKVASFIHNPRGRGSKKRKYLTVVERGGRARSAAIPDRKRETLEPILCEIADREAHLMTDGDASLVAIGGTFTAHDSVNHGQKQYARGDAHINTAEAFHLYICRAKMGVWHQWSETHQHRYVEEIQFHWDHRPKTQKVGKKRHTIMASTPVFHRLRCLFELGAERQLRWADKHSVRETQRSVRQQRRLMEQNPAEVSQSPDFHP
jgi:ISXO2-like transposase domain/Transposase zinc-ribbon domain